MSDFKTEMSAENKPLKKRRSKKTQATGSVSANTSADKSKDAHLDKEKAPVKAKAPTSKKAPVSDKKDEAKIKAIKDDQDKIVDEIASGSKKQAPAPQVVRPKISRSMIACVVLSAFAMVFSFAAFVNTFGLGSDARSLYFKIAHNTQLLGQIQSQRDDGVNQINALVKLINTMNHNQAVLGQNVNALYKSMGSFSTRLIDLNSALSNAIKQKMRDNTHVAINKPKAKSPKRLHKVVKTTKDQAPIIKHPTLYLEYVGITPNGALLHVFGDGVSKYISANAGDKTPLGLISYQDDNKIIINHKTYHRSIPQ